MLPAGGAGNGVGNRTQNSRAAVYLEVYLGRIPYFMRNRHRSSDREPPARSTHQQSRL